MLTAGMGNYPVSTATGRGRLQSRIRRSRCTLVPEALLKAVNHGDFTIKGFRNRDIRELLFTSKPASQQEERQRSGIVTRRLRILRAHGLIAKVPKSHRYHLTEEGRIVITALLAAREANTTELTKMAA